MNTLIYISALGILSLLAEIFNARKAIVPITIIGLLAIFGFNISEYNHLGSYYNNMMVVDKFSVAFSSSFIIITVFLVALSHEFYKEQKTKISDYVGIKVFLLSGAVAMVSFGNLSMFFLGIEVLSISLYILAASNRLNLKSNEAGMKYFLMGSFASGIILFGICLIYGATGSFDLNKILILINTQAYPQWYYIGIVFLLIGMLFKIATVPFHFWAPDVYEGSPALTTATMSTLAKIVAMATLYKLVTVLLPIQLYSIQIIIVCVAIASMLLGNIMALRQNNVKRMFAFSGISHAGFMVSTLLLTSNAASTLLYYASAYAIAGIAFFAVVMYVTKDKENETIDSFNGLGKTHPLLAGILTAALLSMAGIPILSGFFAKFFLLNQLVYTDWLIVVFVAIISSIISVGYYFKIIIAMYTKESEQTLPNVPVMYQIVAVVALILNIALGLFPNVVLKLL
ncbi:NADH-quinone oxidoreductase subunit N [Flavobacterium psychrophilum]|uniref:NADH-quinone oxidoreductase subunit N n=1 Tax=Flavobacterium psychrophilum TaxID=96345 RepID=UPI000B7C1101|nr:NADH-quinone oxidoreductase subunit N [Flavobacterium psychrophilum]SNB24934.1 NADH-quinone oxidoreductase subunit N [Flavobacterium psychrophilum]